MAFNVFIQNNVTKGMDISGIPGTEIIEMGDNIWELQDFLLENKDREYIENKIVFCSINAARRIDFKSNHLSYLHSGIMTEFSFGHAPNIRPGIFDWNGYTSVIPHDLLLNPNGRLMRFMDLENCDFDGKVFIRPNSGWKPFTGFDTTKEDIQIEYNTLKQIEHVKPGELVVVCDYKKVVEEYRFWVIGNKIVTNSSYSWDEDHTFKNADSDTTEFANHVVLTFSETYIINEYVLDVAVMEDGSHKVVELNAISTSGWYGAMDPKALIKSIMALYH